MIGILDAARYLMDRYQQEHGSSIDEMKLHKLLYLAQRESYAVFDEPLFPEKFEGWKYGPVSPQVRQYVRNVHEDVNPPSPSDVAAALLDNVFAKYRKCSSWSLSDLTHGETSWVKSRKGLRDDENGDRLLLDEDIKGDAVKAYPYLRLKDELVTITPMGQDALPRRDLRITREDAEERLDIIAALQDGWRGGGTKAFSRVLVARVAGLIATLPTVPLPVPSVREGIQLEFEDSIKGFLTIMLFADDLAEVYAVSPSGAYEVESTIRGDDVQVKVQAFQEERLWRS